MNEQLRLGDSDALIALNRAWETTLKLLASEINRPSFESWVKTARPVSMNGNVATIGAGSELAKIFLEKYAELIQTALESALGTEVDIVYVVAPPEDSKARPSEPKQPLQKAGIITPVSLPLNDKYGFSSFIVGPCNRLAHAAAKSVAEKPGAAYNPFFLYGGPGLGKTHLLQAIGHHILAHHPKLKVTYVSGETFTYQYVTALREHRSEDFRSKYRSIDVWLVDDVQFLAGKERTKEEFFHTFNALYQMNKQVVLSSDRSPKDLQPMEERLRSRFESGLVADIAPPDLETRIAILQNKAQSEKASVSFEVLETIASLIQTNIRALEGALITVLAYSSLMKQALTVSLAQDVLIRYLDEKKFSELTPDAVQRAVADAFGVGAEDLRDNSRHKEIVVARHVAMYLSRELTGDSLQAIGKAFGRDHATIIHACRKVKERLEQDPAFKNAVDQVAEDLKAGRF